MSCEAPLPSNALARLRAMPGDKDGEEVVALASGQSHEAARSLLGLAGYCIGMFRPDGAHAYAALSQQVSHNLTDFARRSTLQLCAYLVATSDLALTFRRTGQSAVGYADSSSMNGGAGQS